MADTNAQADIRGIDIDKLAKGFADEENIFKQFVTVSSTKAREIRWFQKSSGFLDSSDTTAITTSQIANVSFKARPVAVEQSWTRQTSYIRKYFVESPMISMEDINDTDVDILATNVRDLVRAVERQIDSRIYTVLSTGSGVQTAAAVADGWDDAVTGNPILDILNAKQMIRSYGYDPEGAVLAINSIEHKNLLNYLINVKGSSIPSFAAEKLGSGVVMELLGCRVVVSENAPTDQALVFVPQRAATWKSFVPISSVVMDEPGIGKKIRVWEEGECLLTDPKASFLISDTVV
jgi:hypothetical protein